MRASMVAFGVSSLAMVVLIGVLLVAHITLSVCQNLQAAFGNAASSGPATVGAAPLIHVCFSCGGPDLRPFLVAVRSLLAAAGSPERLSVHLITSHIVADWAQQALRLHLPGVHIRIHQNSELHAQIEGLLGGTRAVDPFDFAPFYIDEYFTSGDVHVAKVIYLDAEVVVQGDIAELFDLDLGGKVVAAVPDCRLHLEDVVNSDSLAQLGFASKYDLKACGVGVDLLVIDLEKWRSQGITAKIEEWLVRSRVAGGRSSLWRAHWPQAAFLLAIGAASATKSLRAEAFRELGDAWRCDGLGLPSLSAIEALGLKQQGVNDTTLSQLRVSFDEDGSAQPRLTLCTATGKLVHFSGAAKPWLDLESNRYGLCAAPAQVPKEFWNSAQAVRIANRESTVVSCQELWSLFASPDVLGGDGEDDEETEAPGELDHDRQWDKSHKTFVDNLRKQVDAEQSRDTDVEKEERLKRLLKKMKQKDEELQKRRVVGGFMVGQSVKSMADISVRGQVVVPKQTVGTIQGPSLKNPGVRINVFFKARLDGKFRSVNVLPREILLVEEE